MNNITEPSSTQAQEHVNMLEAEMESLRRRMKLLETRVAEIDDIRSTAAHPGSLGEARAAAAGVPDQEQRTTSAASTFSSSAHAANASPSDAHSPAMKRRHSSTSRKSNHSQPKQSARPRRRSRTSKLKRQLLFAYGLLIGGAVVAVLVLMIINIFGTEPIISDGLRSGSSTSGSDSSEVDIEIDSKPDLDELRRAIENAEQ